MQDLPKLETLAQAREVLLGMAEGQEITVESDEWEASITKHGEVEYKRLVPGPRDRDHQPPRRLQDPAGARRPRPLSPLTPDCASGRSSLAPGNLPFYFEAAAWLPASAGRR